MTTLRTAAQQVLEALDGVEALLTSMDVTHLLVYEEVDNAITALRAALAEPVQAPHMYPLQSDRMQIDPVTGDVRIGTAPPQRKPRHVSYVCPQCHWSLDERNPLTEEKIHDCFQQRHKNKATERRMITRAIERVHGIGCNDE